jgi:hypothetical protein
VDAVPGTRDDSVFDQRLVVLRRRGKEEKKGNKQTNKYNYKIENRFGS